MHASPDRRKAFIESADETCCRIRGQLRPVRRLATDRTPEVEARAAAAEIKALMRRTAEDIIRVGHLLIDMKGKLGHGNFLSWLDAEFGMSQSSADRFVQVAKKFANKLPNLGNLPVSALYELAAPSTPPEVQAEVERRIAAGEIVSAAEVQRLKREATAAPVEDEAACNAPINLNQQR